MIATREIYWNVSHVGVMYVLFTLAAAVFLYGFYLHIRTWGRSLPADWNGHFRVRLKNVAVYALGQGRVHGVARVARLRHLYAGVFHAFFFFGFIGLFAGTLVVMVHEDFGLHIMQGDFYLWFQSLALDLCGVFAIVGLVMALARRFFFKPARLDNEPRDWLIPAALIFILCNGFALESLRIAATRDPFAAWSPVGAILAGPLTAVPEVMLRLTHVTLWWTHLVTVLALLAALPYTKLRHVFTAPLNIYFRSPGQRGAVLQPIDLDTAQSFGVRTVEQFSFKSLLDLDACTECGRCQDACPAYASGKPLSPKKLIFDLRDLLHAENSANSADPGSPVAADVVGEPALWACTTCMACMEACPVFIEHVPKIVDMRRYLVMEEGRLPGTMEQAVRSLESHGHPFSGAAGSRLDWAKGLGVRVLKPGDRAEYLYWVGCATALNARNHRTARALVRILNEAGIDFGVLGEDENCTGDPARRMGNEYLFQTLARQNIDTINAREFQKILVTCPHCLNSLKNEYTALGSNFDVIHHSQLLSELVRSGRYISKSEDADNVTFHDPCYLGRYNGVFDAPREAIAATGAHIVEMKQHREASFCCGAGGGRMWAEEPVEMRVSNLRARQALETGADKIGVGCPFCMTMMEEAVNSERHDRDVKVYDIAEILAGAD